MHVCNECSMYSMHNVMNSLKLVPVAVSVPGRKRIAK